MKRCLVIVLLIVPEFISLQAQNFGLRIGMNKSFMDGYMGDVSYSGGGISGIQEDVRNHLSFNAGVVADFPLLQRKVCFSVESGMILKTIGKELSVRYSSFSMSRRSYVDHFFESKIRVWYMNFPVNAKLSFPVGKARLTYQLGYYFNIGLGGNENNSSISFGHSNDDDITPFDNGLSTGFAITVKHIEIGLLCAAGITDIDPSAYSIVHNKEVSLHIRFILPQKDKPFEKTDTE
jgi:hypothetical protein